MNPLVHTYLPHSQRKVQFHQELLIFFWKFCEHNRKFLFFVLKSSDVLDILTPILHHLNDARADQVMISILQWYYNSQNKRFLGSHIIIIILSLHFRVALVLCTLVYLFFFCWVVNEILALDWISPTPQQFQWIFLFSQELTQTYLSSYFIK